MKQTIKKRVTLQEALHIAKSQDINALFNVYILLHNPTDSTNELWFGDYQAELTTSKRKFRCFDTNENKWYNIKDADYAVAVMSIEPTHTGAIKNGLLELD